MKFITAIIQPDRLDAVRESLLNAKITRITVSQVSGHGRQAEEDLYRGQIVISNLIPKIRIDVACNDEFAETVINAILSSAKHGEGEIGDGKIFVRSMEECIRIRTGERGGDAI